MQAKRVEPRPIPAYRTNAQTSEGRDLRLLDDPKMIQEYEKRPAYDRYNIQLDDVSEASAQKEYGNVISIDDDSHPRMSSHNSHIHVTKD